MSDKNLKRTSGTDWEALEAQNDDDLDYSDIPPLEESFFSSATLRIPIQEAKNFVRLDSDVVNWLEHQSNDYTVLINQILRQHIQGLAKSCEQATQ